MNLVHEQVQTHLFKLTSRPVAAGWLQAVSGFTYLLLLNVPRPHWFVYISVNTFENATFSSVKFFFSTKSG